MKMYKISEDELRRIFHDALEDYQIPDEEVLYFDDVVDHAFKNFIKDKED